MLKTNYILQKRYKILEQLGQGGMGTVYLANDLNFDRFVAVKSMLVASSELLQAFEREAKLLSSLRHPSLPVVIDYFGEQSTYCLVMDYVKGDSLAAYLRRTGAGLPLDKAIKIAHELLDVLEYLHTSTPQIIHRDIKPDNLKINPAGRLMLLDFGLAKATSTGQTKSIFGFTPQYAPLEQIRYTGTDPRSDLFSAAATLYHLMTGIQPPSALDRADAILNGTPDPLSFANRLNPAIPESIANALATAMSLDPNRRPATAQEMRELLERTPPISFRLMPDALPEVPPHPVQKWKGKTKHRVLIAAGISILTIGLWFTARARENQGMTREIPIPQPAAAKTAKTLVMPEFADKERKLPVTGVVEVNARIDQMIPSPDHRYLYLFDRTAGTMRRLDLTSRTIDKSISFSTNLQNVSISRDGKKLFVCSSPMKKIHAHDALRLGNLQIIDTGSFQIERSFTIPFDAYDVEQTENDGFLYLTGAGFIRELAVVDVNTTSVVSRSLQIRENSSIDKTPDGSRLYVSRSNNISALLLPFDTNQKHPDYNVNFNGEVEVSGPLFISPDNKIAVSQRGGILRIGNPSSEEDLKPIKMIRGLRDVAFYPAKSRVILSTVVEGRPIALHVFSYPEFQELHNIATTRMLYKLYWHEATQTLFAAVDERTDYHTMFEPSGNIWLIKMDQLLL